MSKKSNFLRTVGVNPVLTLAGAPSCATTWAGFKSEIIPKSFDLAL